ncbi:(R)-mandelonitrile lyase [Pedobacter sp. NJ-S-72]
MEIKRSGSQPSGKGPAEYFTGSVRIDPLINPPEPSRVAMALVTFEPGARTAWHTHPFGQTLIVTAGSGWVQREGDKREEIYQGDVIYFLPGEKHWHGARYYYSYEPYCYPGEVRRFTGRLDGTGD